MKFATYSARLVLMLVLLVIATTLMGGVAMLGELAVGLFIAVGVAVGNRVGGVTPR